MRGLFRHPGEGDVTRSCVGDGGLLLHSYFEFSIDQVLQTPRKWNKPSKACLICGTDRFLRSPEIICHALLHIIFCRVYVITITPTMTVHVHCWKSQGVFHVYRFLEPAARKGMEIFHRRKTKDSPDSARCRHSSEGGGACLVSTSKSLQLSTSAVSITARRSWQGQLICYAVCALFRQTHRMCQGYFKNSNAVCKNSNDLQISFGVPVGLRTECVQYILKINRSRWVLIPKE